VLQELSEHVIEFKVFQTEDTDLEFSESIDNIIEAYISYVSGYYLLVQKNVTEKELSAAKEKMDHEISKYSTLIHPYLLKKISTSKTSARALKEKNMNFLFLMIILIIFGLLVSGVLSWTIFRSVSISVEKLIQAIKVVGKGVFEVKLDPVLIKSKDEIGNLALSFKEMTRELQEITVSRDELERKVKERTVELNEKVQKLDKSQEAMLFMVEDLDRYSQELKTSNTKLEMKTQELQQQNIELEIQKKVVEDANRLKSEFLSTMSHELRTPLNSVIALSRVLIMQAQQRLTVEENSYLEIVERNGKRLLSLINDILDLSKIEAGKMEVNLNFVSVSIMLNNIKENLSPIINEKELNFKLSIVENLPKIETDESKLHQILQNIISNSVKFTQKGSIDIAVNFDSEKTYITIKDTGIGISAAELPHVFEEFRQVDGSISRQYDGTGLGLAIVHKLIKILGGKIEVSSKPEQGTCFKLEFPINWSAKEASL